MAKGYLDLLLLSVLRRGPQHGYTIVTTLRERSGGEFDLAEGTVYPALHKLEADGLIRSDWDVVDGRRRRVYELTSDGHAAMSGQRRAWRRFVRGVEAVTGT